MITAQARLNSLPMLSLKDLAGLYNIKNRHRSTRGRFPIHGQDLPGLREASNVQDIVNA